jgi:hypothetical protein
VLIETAPVAERYRPVFVLPVNETDGEEADPTGTVTGPSKMNGPVFVMPGVMMPEVPLRIMGII